MLYHEVISWYVISRNLYKSSWNAFFYNKYEILSAFKMNPINKIITTWVILTIQIQVSEQAKINNHLFGRALERWNLQSLL